ncbi:molybdate ABC transporter permease subunit [Neobacillus notoginsengisoli]|uniref:Molybdenum transport system permease n=1 Tax=Neobacillus notoginsengisoli TaxID=1578198 RepID=A0A417YXM8_9BACI|nr:molybdate ABC transporter permease subunit [Neobacillus notoginsengisoli]RHW42334.1 molybdate ABC transporter permease subunit [Neobacillus notoginsengisoli]
MADPIILSIQTATFALCIAFPFGTLLARLMAGKRFKGQTAVETLFLLPIVLPPTVIGFLLIILFGKHSPVGLFIESVFGSSMMFTPWAAAIASTVVAFPLMYQSAKAGFESLDSEIEEAARMDGAGAWKTFYHITLPLSSRALITGGILSFARALGEFGATLMFAGNIPGKTQTVPIAIYVAMESGQTERAWALVIIIIIISFAMLYLSSRLKSR